MMSARKLWLLAVLVGVAALAPSAQAAAPNCATAGGSLVSFPTQSPVWQFCVLPPSTSSGTNGSAIEIREAFYNGHKVFKRAHNPILNVKYKPGSQCACYRDWIYEEAKYEVKDVNGTIINMPGDGNIYDNASSVRTICDAGGGAGDFPPPDDPTCGSSGFCGIAMERFPDHITLTSQNQAGWYRYEAKWSFYTDGRVMPTFAYAAVPDSCVQNGSHHHNTYWRFDFDIDDPGNDAVGDAGINQAMTETGTRRPAEPAGAPPLKVYDKVSNRGYHVVPQTLRMSASYDPFGGPSGPPWNGSFTIGDAWAVKYKTTTNCGAQGSGCVASEIDDGQQCCGTSECPIGNTFLGWSNNENIDGQDVVVWYHEGAVHPAGEFDFCARIGPTLEPFGDWAP
jgi:hypothetical protein